MKLLGLLALLSVSSLHAADFCQKYDKHPLFINSVEVVAKNMKSSLEELCSNPSIYDIYVTSTDVVSVTGESIPHTWVTLHYAEHSCQYFVREVDLVVTKKNCYNTW